MGTTVFVYFPPIFLGAVPLFDLLPTNPNFLRGQIFAIEEACKSCDLRNDPRNALDSWSQKTHHLSIHFRSEAVLAVPADSSPKGAPKAPGASKMGGGLWPWVMMWLSCAFGQTAQCRDAAGLSLLAHKRQMSMAQESYVPRWDWQQHANWTLHYSAQGYYVPQGTSTTHSWCYCGTNDAWCVLGLLQNQSEHASLGEVEITRHDSQSLVDDQSFQNRTWLCRYEGCEESYPDNADVCMNYKGSSTCLEQTGNCLYATSSAMNTAEGCGLRLCFCAKVAPGQCTPENFPGYTIVQNGAYNLTTGEEWYPVGNGSTRVYPPDHRVWEPVGGPGNHACRGDNSSDNNPRHYWVYALSSLSECKERCQRTCNCLGIEYSAGRCEIWRKVKGTYRHLYYYEEIPIERGEFTCLRYGWNTSKLVPVGPSGTSHPCRGRTSIDNRPYYYTVISGITDIEECKAICAARRGSPCVNYRESGAWGCEPKCSGIEFSLGRCELWHVEIESFNPSVSGYTCLKFDMST